MVKPTITWYEVTAKNIRGEDVGTGKSPPQAVFYLANYPIEDDSEIIYVSGASQVRDTDYTIDNETGEITFLEGHIPEEGVAIKADYDYATETALPTTEEGVLRPIDYGTTGTGEYCTVRCFMFKPSGNAVNDGKFYAQDLYDESKGLFLNKTEGWFHKLEIKARNAFKDPRAITLSEKESWAYMPESEPGTPNVSNVAIDTPSQFIYITIRPDPRETVVYLKGKWANWAYRLTYTYP